MQTQHESYYTYHSVLKGIGDFMFVFGVAALSVMSIVGYIAMFLLLLYGCNSHGHYHGGGGFFTGFFLGAFLFSSGPRSVGNHRDDIFSLLLMSFIFGVIVAALALSMGFNLVGYSILIGWAVSATLVAIGGLLSNAMEYDTPVFDEREIPVANAYPAAIYSI